MVRIENQSQLPHSDISEIIEDTRWVASQFLTSKIRVQAAASSGQMGRKIKGAARFFLCPHVLIRIPYPDHPNHPITQNF